MVDSKSVDNEVLLNAIEKVETSVGDVQSKVNDIREKQIHDFHEIERLKEKQQELEDRDSCPAIHMHTKGCLANKKANKKAMASDSGTSIPIPLHLAEPVKNGSIVLDKKTLKNIGIIIGLLIAGFMTSSGVAALKALL